MMRKVALSIPVLLLFTIVLPLFSVGTKAQSHEEAFSVAGVRIGMTEVDTLNVLDSYLKTMKGGCQEIEGTLHDGHVHKSCAAETKDHGLRFEWILVDYEVVSFLARSNGSFQYTVSNFSKAYGKPSKRTESSVEWKTSDEYLSVSKQRDSRRGEEIVVFLLKM